VDGPYPPPRLDRRGSAQSPTVDSLERNRIVISRSDPYALDATTLYTKTLACFIYRGSETSVGDFYEGFSAFAHGPEMWRPTQDFESERFEVGKFCPTGYLRVFASVQAHIPLDQPSFSFPSFEALVLLEEFSCQMSLGGHRDPSSSKDDKLILSLSFQERIRKVNSPKSHTRQLLALNQSDHTSNPTIDSAKETTIRISAALALPRIHFVESQPVPTSISPSATR
jgi:hypothetical protein